MLHKLISFTVLYLIFACHNIVSDENKKEIITPEQKKEYDKQYKAFMLEQGNIIGSKNKYRSDSILKILKYKDTTTHNCLDKDCYITKSDFNRFLYSFPLSKSTNLDSIRTNILFKLLTDRFTQIKSDQMLNRQNKISGKNKIINKISAYKLLILMSTDSTLLAKSIKSFSNKELQFFNPIRYINHNLKSNDSIIAEMVFKENVNVIDFEIDKNIISNISIKKWTHPIKYRFGFISFYIINNNEIDSSYYNILSIINYAKMKLNDSKLKHIKKRDSLIIEDTLIVKFWAKPAILTNEGTFDQIDTNKLAPVSVLDYELPSDIKSFVKEQYYKNGTIMFENFKTDYCLWSLKIDSCINGDSININSYIQNRYMVDLILKNMKTLKLKIREQDERKNVYFDQIYKTNLAKNKVTGKQNKLKAYLETVDSTNVEIQKCALKWVRKNIIFNEDIFNENFLPKLITEY